jgi:hypothetical protein
LTDLDSALHDDPLIKLMLLTLNRENVNFKNLLPLELSERMTRDLFVYLLENVEGMNYFFGEFTYDKYMDFLQLIGSQITIEHLDTILVLFREK